MLQEPAMAALGAAGAKSAAPAKSSGPPADGTRDWKLGRKEFRDHSLRKLVVQLAEMQMSFNLQYLNLQNKMQGENRQYSTISNVLKTKHDTTKNSINNIRFVFGNPKLSDVVILGVDGQVVLGPTDVESDSLGLVGLASSRDEIPAPTHSWKSSENSSSSSSTCSTVRPITRGLATIT